MACDFSLLVVEDPAHHACVDCEGQGRTGASHDPQTIKLLQPRITSLFFGTDDAHEIFSVVIEHGHVGPKQGWIDNVQPLDHPAIGVDPAAKVLVRTIRSTFQLYLLDTLETAP